MTDKQRRNEPEAETDPPSAATAVRTEAPRMPLGQWLVANMPRGTDLEIPRGRASHRPTPFIDDDDLA